MTVCLLPGAGRADAVAGSAANQAASALFDLMYGRVAAQLAADRLSASFPPSWPVAWRRLAADAIWEEYQAERPQFEAKFSQIFETTFTTQELAAGVEALRSPVAGAPDQPAQLDPAAAAKLGASPAGRAFVQKFDQARPQFDAVAQQMIGEWLPGVLRRLGEKAESTVAAGPADDTERLQDEVACQLLPADRMRETLKPKFVEGLGGMFKDVPGHPEWQALIDQAMSDEVDASGARFCLAMGQWIGRGLTPSEAQQILDFLKTPSGAAVRAAIAASLVGPRSRPSPAQEAAVERFMRSPPARKLMANLSEGAKLGGDAGEAYAKSVMPGVFRRFGEKAAPARP